MIPRYDRPQMSRIWSEESKFSYFLKVELAVLKAYEARPGFTHLKGLSDKIAAKVEIRPKRIQEIEETTRHDVISFCTSITEQLDKKEGRFFHFGVTSSDVIDTALTLQIKDSLLLFLPALEKMLDTLKTRAVEMKTVIGMGRSHGMFAEPMSFGVKLLGHYAELARRLQDYKNFLQEELTGQLSGAVGNYTILDSKLEKEALASLGLKPEPVSTQVIPRDRIAKLVSIGALFASGIERLAVEIRHLHRSEVSELHEGFSKGQKGSSIMPHKKNPISGENLTGLARVVRSHLTMALENVVLWHERDISHSSAERIFLPDHFTLLLYMTERLEQTLKNLVFHTETIESRVYGSFEYISSYYLHELIKQSEFSREEQYEIVQKAAFGSKNLQDFHLEVIKLAKEKGNSALNIPVPTPEQLKGLYLKEAENIFARV